MFDEHEPAEPELTPDLKAIEGKLARLVPAGARVDRDRLMFEAGRAAARPGRPGYIAEPSWLGGRVWPAATMLMTAAALLLTVSLMWQHQALQIALHQNVLPTVVPVVNQPHDTTPLRNTSPELAFSNWNSLWQPTDGYLGVRYIALTRGVGAIDAGVRDSGAGDSTNDLQRSQRDMLNELLPFSTHEKSPRS